MSDPNKPSRTLAVVVPAYNEAEVLGAFWAKLSQSLATVADRYDWSVTFVVDPSDDGTEALVRELASENPRVGAVLMARRAGHQMSLVAGMDRVQADACITMDSDLQHPPELIPDMLALFEGGADVVQTMRVQTEGVGLVKRGASTAYYRLLNRVSEVELVDGGADFRLLSRRVLDVLQHDIRERNQFLRGLVQWMGFPTATVPFRAPQRAAGSSKYSMQQSMRLATAGLVSFSKMPLRVGLVGGLVAAGCAVVFAVIVVISFLSGDQNPAGWTSLALLITLLASVQLVTLGLIGVYVGAVFDEVKGRPPYVVRETIPPAIDVPAQSPVLDFGDQ